MKRNKLVVLGIVVSIIFSLLFCVGYNNKCKTESENNVIKNETLLSRKSNDIIRKKNVKYKIVYSSWKKTSGTLYSGEMGGAITCEDEMSGDSMVVGNIYGLDFDIKAKKIYSKQTQKVEPNKKAYMESRKVFHMEKGTRIVKTVHKYKMEIENRYTVKRPVGFEYRLISKEYDSKEE